MSDVLISIVLPVMNQGDHIAKVVTEFEEALQKLPHPHETILVPNGCRDDSVAVCHRLAQQFPTVQVVVSKRGGWGLALKEGWKVARGDLLCFTNSARTTPNDLMLHLLYAGVYQNAVIKANRKIRDNWQRRLGSLLYNLQCRTLFDLSYWDINGTPKVFPRSFDKLLTLERDDEVYEVEFSYVCRKEGYPVLEVPIFSTARHGGASTTTYRTAIRLYWEAYRFKRSLRKYER